MKTLKEHTIDKAVEYHIENCMPIYDNIFRPHSEMNYKLFNEFKNLYESGEYKPSDSFEKELLESNIGEFGFYKNELVPLDFPLNEAEYKGKNVELDKPKRGGRKKFYVYVKDPKSGNIKKVEFGDTTGLKVKFSDESARKSFVARHNCSDKTDKTKPGYWSCRLPKFAASVGLSGGGNFFW